MQRAFTLIELLVVITIIVILLALLTPALDKAIYQAELAVCGSRQNTLGVGTMTYAVAYRRFYMDRNTLHQPAQLRSNPPNTDFRPTLGRAFDVNALNDPLSQAVDLESNYPDGKNRTDFAIFASYNVFVNWDFWWDPAPPGRRRMRKVGDDFNWIEGTQEYRFRLLFSDRDVVMPGDRESQSSHPDRDGRMHNLVVQDGVGPWSNAVDQTTGWPYLTISLWRVAGSHERGPVDDQFLFDDLSLTRYEGVVADTRADDRMVPVPVFRSGSTTNSWIHLPSQGTR